MRKPKLRVSLSSLLVLTILLQSFTPAFAVDSGSIASKFEIYQTAYQNYAKAVASGAPLDEVASKLDTYLAAQNDYERLASPSKNPTAKPAEVSTGAPSETDLGQQLQPTEAQTTITSTATTSAASESKSWFGKMFQKAKDAVFGKKGVKEMPLWEKVLWSVGRSLVPTFGVMLATAILAPLSPVAMIAGGIVVGASLGGLMTYAFEKRMNAKYRDAPKDNAKIWRDVSVSATVEAIMAPFNLATGGLFGMVGPTMGNAIFRVAMTQATLSFTGAALSSTVGGGVKNLWGKYCFHYPEKIVASEKRIDQILEGHIADGSSLSPAETKELGGLRAQIDEMKGESYSHDDFLKDMKRAAVSSVISGFAGSILSDRMYTFETGRWADRLSVRVFGSTANGKALSSVISTLPTNFLSGSANAALEKSFISDDIKEIRAEQGRFTKGSAPYEYYEGVIAGLNQRKESINVAKEGLTTMGSNLAVRAAQLSVEALKYNLYDGPKARRQAIDRLYHEKDGDWQKASDLYDKYQNELANKPDFRKIGNATAFAKAQSEYNNRVNAARRGWLSQCVKAKEAEGLPENQSNRQQLTQQYDRNFKLNQMIELGRLEGGMAYLTAMKTMLKENRPELANASDHDLTRAACDAIRQSYQEKFQLSSDRLAGMKETFKKYDDYKAGRLLLSPDEAKRLQGRVAMISPSQYKTALVEQKVYEMKANNTRWKEVRGQMPSLLGQSEKEIVQEYGGNWVKVLAAEAYANGLAKYKYSPDGNVGLGSRAANTIQKVPGMVSSQVVDDYKERVNTAIAQNILPQNANMENEFESVMSTFAKSALTSGHSALVEGVLGSAKGRILSSFNRPR